MTTLRHVLRIKSKKKRKPVMKLKRPGFDTVRIESDEHEWRITPDKKWIQHIRTKNKFELIHITSDMNGWAKHLRKKSWVTSKTIHDFKKTLRINAVANDILLEGVPSNDCRD